jgi:hypothetical protein
MTHPSSTLTNLTSDNIELMTLRVTPDLMDGGTEHKHA